MGKRLLILGGFPQMIDIVTIAREMKIYTILVDRDPGSPAKPYADKAYDISTHDVDELLKICIEEKIDGVFTGFEDFNIHIARELCTRLNLPFYASSEQLDIVTNKKKFKVKCREYSVPIIEQYSFENAEKEGNYPYIVKPADSYGSRGITVCNSSEELQYGYKIAVETSSGKEAIIERFVNTPYGIELFYTVVNGNIHLTATADRFVEKVGQTAVPLPVAEVFPSSHSKELHSEVDFNIRKMLNGLGIKNGVILIQALYEKGQFYIYEMAYRLTGEQHYFVVEKQHGINLAKMMIKLALNESVDEFDTELIDEKNFTYPSINLSVLLKPGVIGKIEGLSDVCKLNNVLSHICVYSEKDTIANTDNYSRILIRINLSTDSYGELCKTVKRINDTIKVTSTDGENMIMSRFVLKDR